MASEDPQKSIAKKYKKNMKLSDFFSNLLGLNYLSYQLFEATLKNSVYPKLLLLFWSQDTQWSKNMRILGLKLVYVFELLEHR